MSKTAKKVAAPAAPGVSAGTGQLRSLTARRAAAAAGEISAAGGLGVIDGRVVAVEAGGQVRAVLAGGEAIEALCPAHIDAAWLKEACARAPVAAAFALARPSGRHVLWGIFPDAAHADVRADVVIRGRQVKVEAESVQLSSTDARLDLEADGKVTLKGRDVTSHARRVNRIKGGSIRLN
jgi:hypothetical protein